MSVWYIRGWITFWTARTLESIARQVRLLVFIKMGSSYTHNQELLVIVKVFNNWKPQADHNKLWWSKDTKRLTHRQICPTQELFWYYFHFDYSQSQANRAVNALFASSFYLCSAYLPFTTSALGFTLKTPALRQLEKLLFTFSLFSNSADTLRKKTSYPKINLIPMRMSRDFCINKACLTLLKLSKLSWPAGIPITAFWH